MTMHRREKDSMGAIDVPADKLWGAQTQRSLEHFRISTEKMPVSLIRALALTKRAAAKVNQDLGLLVAEKPPPSSMPPTKCWRANIPTNSPCHLADRLRHPEQHEHERGAGEPRKRVAWRRTRHGAQDPPER